MFEVDDDNDDNDDATLLLALQESDDESEKADKLKQCELNPIPQIEEHAAEVLAAVAEALEGTERDARISEPGQAEAPPPPAANEVAAFPLANEETTVADSNGSPPHTNRQRRIKELREQLEIKRLELELKQLEEEETRQSNQCKTVKESSVDGSLQVSLACKSDNTPRNTSSSISPAGSKRKQSSDRSIGPEDEFSRKQRQAIQQEHSLKQSEPKFKQYLSSTVVSLGDPASASGDFVETYSRLRLSNRLVSAVRMDELMRGRKFVNLHQIEQTMRGADIPGDWVSIGVVIEKSAPRSTANNQKFCSFKLSQLRTGDGSETVNLLLFGDAYKQHWKETVGSVIALLNPEILKPTEIDHPQRLMKLGTAMDLGRCNGIRKDGQQCTMHIDVRRCEYCDFHIQAAFKKANKNRSEFSRAKTTAAKQPSQSKRTGAHGTYSVNGRLVSTSVITASGLKRSLEAEKMKLAESRQMEALLGENSMGARYAKIVRGEKDIMANKMTSVAANLKPGQPVQSKEDFRRLFEDNATGKPTKMLNLTDSSSSSDGESTTAKQNLQQVESYIKKHQIKFRRQDPNQPFSNPQGGVTKEQIESLKRQAAEYGKKSSDDENEQQRDLTFDQLEEKRAQRAKKAKSLAAQFSIDLNSDKTRKILADRTADGVADEAAMREFNRITSQLEAKERMMQRMSEIHEKNVKAFRCDICDLLTEFVVDSCRQKGHIAKPVQCIKRFFQCCQCAVGRTTTLNSKLPGQECPKCRGRDWRKSSMLSKSTTHKHADHLKVKVRGTEHGKFLDI